MSFHRSSRRLLSTRINISLMLLATFTMTVPINEFSAAPVDPDDAGAKQRTSVASEEKAAQLLPGRTVKRRVASGQIHSYQVTLKGGQFLHVTLDQRGIDLVATIFDPSGKNVVEIDTSYITTRPERLRLIAGTVGRHRLEVRPVGRARIGRYEVGIRELRAATPIDRKLVAADLALAEGRKLSEKAGPESFRAALEKYMAALALTRETGDRYQEALALRGIGSTHQQLGHNQEAIQAQSDSLRAFREVRDRAGEAAALNSIGLVHYSMEDKRIGLEFFSKALVLAMAAGDLRQAAISINNIGQAHDWFGEKEKALDQYQQALKLLKEAGDPRGYAAGVISNIGMIYSSVGENQRAIEYYLQSLEISRETGNNRGQAVTLNDMGGAHFLLGQHQKALDSYNLALPLRRTAGDNRGLATTLINIGAVYILRGEYDKVLETLGSALSLTQAEGHKEGETYARYGIGMAYALSNEPNKAIDHFRRGIELSRTGSDRTGQSTGLYFLARTERLRGNVTEALQNVEAALDIVESQRRKIASPGIRASFFGSAREYYDFYIDLLMQLDRLHPDQGYDEKALNASELARARTLVEMLGEADIRQDVDPVLLDEERSLRHSIDAKSEQYRRLFDPNRPTEQGVQLKKEVEQLQAKYERIQGRIRLASPHYVALMLPDPLTVRDIQREVVDDDTVLLEYALGEDRSYLWVIMPNSMTTFELPERNVIEKAARRVYDLLAESEPGKKSTAEIPEDGRLGSNPAYTEAASALSQMILGPVGSLLGKKRLLIVGDGTLNYIPFGALPAPAAQGANADSSRTWAAGDQSLIYRHEIVCLPSASTLAVLRRKLAGRAVPPKSIAIFADPVFDYNDDRVPKAKRKSSRKKDQRPQPVSAGVLGELALQRSAREAGLVRTSGFARLPFSRLEADAIYALARETGALKALDFESNKTAALDPVLKNYRIIHFATHNLINTEHPGLSGVVMSLVDRSGRPQNGFLRLLEVYNLDLNADLVVLSGCQTALGKNIKAEGLVGLTRGFMYAGAARVMASLWKVDDEATAGLMKRFYEAMLVEGQRPAAALRTAQIWMQQQERWRSPYYWAAFVLQGEVR